MWKTIKTLMGNASKGTINDIEVPGKYKDNTIANSINRYFIESIEEKITSIPDPPQTHLDEMLYNSDINAIAQCELKFQKLSMYDLIKINKNIKPKPSGDGITVNIILDAMPIIGEYLLEVINESLESGKFQL
jgi:hypothetical protein